MRAFIGRRESRRLVLLDFDRDSKGARRVIRRRIDWIDLAFSALCLAVVIAIWGTLVWLYLQQIP